MQVVQNTQATQTPVNIHYINTIGAIIDDAVMIHLSSKPLIEIQDIREAKLYRSISYVYNTFFIFCALPLCYALLIYGFTLLEKILIGFLIVVLLVSAAVIKKLRYVLLIKKYDMSFMEFEIKKHSKDDAKNIVRLVNRRIKELKIN